MVNNENGASSLLRGLESVPIVLHIVFVNEIILPLEDDTLGGVCLLAFVSVLTVFYIILFSC